MKLGIKEPYKTALILGLTTSVFVGAAYLLIPSERRKQMIDFIKNKFKFKKDEREMAKPTDVR